MSLLAYYDIMKNTVRMCARRLHNNIMKEIVYCHIQKHNL